MAKRCNRISGQWSARQIDMQRSFAWRVLSRAAHQCLSRIEIELADHGGNDIEELPVTFDDFEAYGVHRSAIVPALAELEALGFIDVTARGVAARAADNRRPNKFRLLTRPWEKIGGTNRPRWERFKTWQEAEATADEARRSAAKEKSASTETVPVRPTMARPTHRTLQPQRRRGST
jgi:DNA-binding transcriptional MocR family regulator